MNLEFISTTQQSPLILKALALILIVVSMILLSSGIGMIIIGNGEEVAGFSKEPFLNLIESNKNLAKLIIGANHALVFLGSTVIYLFFFNRHKWKKFLNIQHFPPQYLLFFPLALFLLYPLMGYAAQWVETLNLPDFFKNLDNDSLKTLQSLLVMVSIWDLLINIMIVGVLAGVGEELLFRGIIQKELFNRYQMPHVAIWLTAVIFSAFHFQIVGFIPKLLIGALLGYAYYLSNSLILPMVIHFLNNSFATVSLYFMGGLKVEDESMEKNVTLLSVAISMMVFGWIFSLIYRDRVKPKSFADE